MRSLQNFVPELLNTSEALSRWISRIHRGFLDVGWIQTNDSGQVVDPVFTLNIVDTLIGYRIYEINDSYSAEVPVFVKVYFYTLSTSSTATTNSNAPFVGFQVGFGTDGAGEFVGGYGPINPKFATFGTSAGGTVALSDNATSIFTKQPSFTGAAFDIRYGAHSYAIFGGAAFFIERIKFNGEVVPTEIVYTYGSDRIASTFSNTMLYGRVSRGGSASGPYSNPSYLPRVESDSFGRVATRFDLSTELYAFESDNLIAFRGGSDFGIVELSFDGVTSKKYLMLKSSRITGSGSVQKPALEASGGISARMDSRETTVGFLGVAWDE